MTVTSAQECSWEIPSYIPVLKPHEAHVWCAQLDAAEVSTYFSLLNTEEKSRAQRFHFTKDQNHFTVARGLLRKILSQYLSTTPTELQFQYNPHGKPFLKNYPDLQFNISHANGMALYAITREESIGIDIEFMGRACDIDGIAERFFSANEYTTLQNVTGQEKIQAFFNGWARKEAFLKALGAGLSYPLAQVEVSLIPQQPAMLLALHDTKLDIADWHLHALEPYVDYAAALVVKGNLHTIQTMRATL